MWEREGERFRRKREMREKGEMVGSSGEVE